MQREHTHLLAMASLQLSGAGQGWQKSTHFGQLSVESPLVSRLKLLPIPLARFIQSQKRGLFRARLLP